MKDGYYTFKFSKDDMIGLIRDNVVIFAIPRKLETNFKIKDKVFIMKNCDLNQNYTDFTLAIDLITNNYKELRRIFLAFGWDIMKDREIEISYENTIRVGDKEIGVLGKMRGIVGFDIRPDDVDYSYMNDFLHGVITDIINPGFYWIGISGRKYKIALPFEEETYDLMI